MLLVSPPVEEVIGHMLAHYVTALVTREVLHFVSELLRALVLPTTRMTPIEQGAIFASVLIARDEARLSVHGATHRDDA